MTTIKKMLIILFVFSGIFLAKAEKKSFSIALISDTHLPKGKSKMIKAVKEINASGVDMTVFLGDLIDSNKGNPETYIEWMAIAKQLKTPWRAIPGNHDTKENFKKNIHPETDFVIDHKGCRFIFFDDTDPVKTSEHNGIVSKQQVAWLDSKLAEAKKEGLKAILFAHIIWQKNKHPDRGWWIRNGDIKGFRNLLSKYKNTIDAFFAGHFHCGLRGWDSTAGGIHEIIIPSACYNTNRFKKDKIKSGFVLEEYRPGWVKATVIPGVKIDLTYMVIADGASKTKELKIPKLPELSTHK
jgi:3',5'-cyclic AMP phosphodiesterase CpdA